MPDLALLAGKIQLFSAPLDAVEMQFGGVIDPVHHRHPGLATIIGAKNAVEGSHHIAMILI
ncbi:hypothetical protein D3C80_1872290 [compost metagenome]